MSFEMQLDGVVLRVCVLMLLGRSGGVIILDGTGRIDINNTYEERLKLLETEALPSVRTTLFGENQNRKFKD